MKVENISAHQQQHDSMGRKAPQWSREKISQLIELYKKHECLWNHWHDSYKCKVKRNRAIEEICFTLRITKFDFGRKIHNLRNQFNTEMKKLEQRVGEAGESVDEPSTGHRCKWIHFESLMFLRNVIEPRPGGYQSSYQAPKKMRLRFDYNSAEDDVNVTMLPANTINSSSASGQHNDDVTQYQHYEEDENDEDATEEFNNFEVTDVVNRATREETFDQKYQSLPVTSVQQHSPAIATLNSAMASAHRINIQKPTLIPQIQNSTPHAFTQVSKKPVSLTEIVNVGNEDSSIIELNANNVTVITSSTPSPVLHKSAPSTSSCSSIVAACNAPFVSGVNASTTADITNKPPTVLPVVRDQWDSFGELVATEFRNLNSDISRKKLKRKIMQAMLEVGEEDDSL